MRTRNQTIGNRRRRQVEGLHLEIEGMGEGEEVENSRKVEEDQRLSPDGGVETTGGIVIYAGKKVQHIDCFVQVPVKLGSIFVCRSLILFGF